MEKNDSDKFSTGLQGSLDNDAASPRSSSETVGGSDRRFRMMTETLYECLDGEISCDQKVPFGRRCFCKWLLRRDPVRTENNFPCLAADNPKRCD